MNRPERGALSVHGHAVARLRRLRSRFAWAGRELPVGALLGLALLALAGCGGTPVRTYESRPGAYDRLEPDELERVREARALWDAGEREEAWFLLSDLAEALPQNLAVGVLLQDLEIELAGTSLGGAERVLESLRRRYRERAELARLDEQSRLSAHLSAALVLDARLRTPEEALALLDEALTRDKACVWAHYGRAHELARIGDLREALRAIDEALDLDGGHLPSRRLEARLLQRVGDRARAVYALELWLADARESPFVERAELARARLDLAVAYLRGERADEALELLLALDPALVPGSEVALVEAAAREAAGDPEGAFAAAERAHRADPTDPLPVLQMALLEEYRLGERGGARELWEQVARLARERSLGGDEPGPLDARALLTWAAARVRLERERAAEVAPAGAVEP